MRRRSRNLLFAATILTFLAAAPLVIFWARGYYIDTKQGVEVIRTGMVLVDTNVPQASVSIDGQAATSERDPVAVRGLLPGRHTVRLEREGFAPWEAEVDVEAEQVTRVDNVVLLRSSPTLATLAAGPLGTFSASPNGAYVVYVVTSGSRQGIWMHTTNDGDEDRRLVDADGLGDEVTAEDVDLLRWSEDGKALLVHGADRWWLLEPHVAAPTAKHLSKLDGIPTTQVQSDPSEPSTVFYRDSQGEVWRWRTASTGAAPERLAAGVVAFTVAPPKLFVLMSEATELVLGTYDLRLPTPKLDEVARLTGTAPADLLVAEGGGQVAVRSSNGSLSVLDHVAGNLEFAPIASGVDSARWSPDGALLAYRRGTELWAHDVQPVGDDEPEFLVTSLASEPELRWYPDARHLVIVQRGTSTSTVSLLHMSRTAPRLSVALEDLPSSTAKLEFARRGADVVYVDESSSDRPLRTATITLGPGEAGLF